MRVEHAPPTVGRVVRRGQIVARHRPRRAVAEAQFTSRRQTLSVGRSPLVGWVDSLRDRWASRCAVQVHPLESGRERVRVESQDRGGPIGPVHASSRSAERGVAVLALELAHLDLAQDL